MLYPLSWHANYFSGHYLVPVRRLTDASSSNFNQIVGNGLKLLYFFLNKRVPCKLNGVQMQMRSLWLGWVVVLLFPAVLMAQHAQPADFSIFYQLSDFSDMIIDPATRSLLVANSSAGLVLNFGPVDSISTTTTPVSSFGVTTLLDGVALDPVTGKIFIALPNQNRVVWWNSIPSSSTPPDGALGQPNMTSTGTGLGPASMNYPCAVAVSGGSLWVYDQGNNRFVIFPSPSPFCC